MYELAELNKQLLYPLQVKILLLLLVAVKVISVPFLIGQVNVSYELDIYRSRMHHLPVPYPKHKSRTRQVLFARATYLLRMFQLFAN